MGRTPTGSSLDTLDRELLAALRQDARIQVSALASALKVSRSTVYSRLVRLEQDGVIAGYTVRVGADYQRSLVRAHMMIKLLPKLTQETIAELVRMPQVAALYSVSGENDLIALIEAADVGELDRLIDDVGMLEGVEKTTSSVILSTKLLR